MLLNCTPFCCYECELDSFSFPLCVTKKGRLRARDLCTQDDTLQKPLFVVTTLCKLLNTRAYKNTHLRMWSPSCLLKSNLIVCFVASWILLILWNVTIWISHSVFPKVLFCWKCLLSGKDGFLYMVKHSKNFKQGQTRACFQAIWKERAGP